MQNRNLLKNFNLIFFIKIDSNKTNKHIISKLIQKCILKNNYSLNFHIKVSKNVIENIIF
jgi:hypothetical protein